ncbi:MAG: hypothetical protein AAGC81_02275 [Pseudomonadota bacterium]
MDDTAKNIENEPWAKLAKEAGLDPIKTDPASRRAFKYCAWRLASIEDRLQRAASAGSIDYEAVEIARELRDFRDR